MKNLLNEEKCILLEAELWILARMRWGNPLESVKVRDFTWVACMIENSFSMTFFECKCPQAHKIILHSCEANFVFRGSMAALLWSKGNNINIPLPFVCTRTKELGILKIKNIDISRNLVFPHAHVSEGHTVTYFKSAFLMVKVWLSPTGLAALRLDIINLILLYSS